ncbi:MAG: acetylxylan esterase, partial [bacterium]
PVIMGVGLQDDVCPPSASFSTFNLVHSRKEYTVYKDSEHQLPESHFDDRFARLRRLFKMD